MNYPVPDRSDQTPNFAKTPEDDTLDIGWAEGTLSDGRPYRAECWCQDQVTMLTIFFSTLGLQAATDADLEQLLVREQLVGFKVGRRFVSGARFADPSRHELWSVNVVIGDDENTFVAHSVPLTPYPRRLESSPTTENGTREAFVTNSTPAPARLGDRFEKALAYTFQAHREQTRKGTDTPYMGHLLGVASLVIEDGGDEDQVIAALLHDAMEDQGGPPRLEDIRTHFGAGVAAIVAACSDWDGVGEKPAWRPRKEKYLEHLKTAPPEVLRVSAADKLYNARAVLADYRSLGEGLWIRFNAPREDTLWYYESLAHLFRRRGPASLARDLDSVVLILHQRVKRNDASSQKKPAGSYERALTNLRGVMARFKRELDDPSAEFLARIRAAGVLSDTDWQHILGEVPKALRFLSKPDPTPRQDEHGHTVINPDADPRNANWLRLASAARKAQHHLPMWAAMWLWQVGHSREAGFWDGVGRIAEELQYPRHELPPS